ncbi:SDR family oxidoreductase [Paenibacillus sp. GCM10012307]|uniref:SDR family oxidoreductase n=1 Tax=Paenibacillus roseus TaxID=2798579 RepID=A0A934J3R3_9BACL|nr:SDR family oxidoreductase [Paenibacillus roseus]MBJ6359752.1 SDR family oxidoreductase [Paenibacillus roseus]
MANKTAIITGASSGIGEATAKELARSGIRLMLAARREDRLVQLKKEIEALGGQAEYRVTDVTSRADMESLAQATIEAYGQIDILVNNAGLMPLSYIRSLKVDEWDRMIDVNIKGVLYGIAAVLPHMEERNEGHIINVSSVAGHEIAPSGAVYSATKFAVRTLTEGLRKELRPDQNIRTTIISPGAVDTELTHSITDTNVKTVMSGFLNKIVPLKGEDIAAAIRYAIEQPTSVSINEIIVRPTSQP